MLGSTYNSKLPLRTRLVLAGPATNRIFRRGGALPLELQQNSSDEPAKNPIPCILCKIDFAVNKAHLMHFYAELRDSQYLQELSFEFCTLP